MVAISEILRKLHIMWELFYPVPLEPESMAAGYSCKVESAQGWEKHKKNMVRHSNAQASITSESLRPWPKQSG